MEGLGSSEAEKLLKKFGRNSVEVGEKVNPFRIFLAQFKSLFILILIAATAISYALGEHIDAIAILAIIVLNSTLGFIQEYRAEKSLEALKRMSVRTARVIRGGIIRVIDAELIVPGDAVIVEEGDRIPADGRLVEEFGLWCNEAVLTGESRPVHKKEGDILYSGALITIGKGTMLVEKTGLNTKFGMIAEITAKTGKETTPLGAELERTSRSIGLFVLAVAGGMLAINCIAGTDMLNALMFSVSLAVAAIPEGLPIVVTITLAIGVQRMAKKNAVVKRLLAVEGLGSIDVICTDKTGTITRNEMAVKKVWASGNEYMLTGGGYADKGSVLLDGRRLVPPRTLRKALTYGALCTDAEIEMAEKPIGDPTEIAILFAAKKAGISKRGLIDGAHPLAAEFPFDPKLKRMVTVHASGNRYLVCAKGAVEVVLGLCTHIEGNKGPIPLDDKMKSEILAKMEEYANSSYRVLAVAHGLAELEEGEFDREDIEHSLVFSGILAIYDAPRDEVYDALVMCNNAGIEVKMLTGDHRQTAISIAREIGLVLSGDDIGEVCITGDELSGIDDVGLDEIVGKVKVFSRVTPEQKLRILKSLKRMGKMVAMTGDGVNDAPALKLADVGVSMGISGTDVAKESGDIVLLDDNFATIVSAVREGRTIFTNIKKFIYFLLSANMAEIAVILMAVALAELALPSSAGNGVGHFLIPLLPLQLLWINLLTDGLPAVALGMDPPPSDAMRRKRDSRRMLSGAALLQLAVISIIIALPGIFLLDWALGSGLGEATARTIMFTYIVVAELAFALVIRTRNLFLGEILTNKFLLLMIAVSLAAHLVALYGPLAIPMKTIPLEPVHWYLLLSAALAAIIVIEGIKHIFRKEIQLF